MALTGKKRKSKINKFINYTREAFFWPKHLMMMGAISVIAFVLALASGGMGWAINPASIVLMAGGLELLVLSAISQNPRFIRAINAKYQKDIEAFFKTKKLVDHYNDLSLDSQRRFDRLRKRVKQVRDGFRDINTSVPQLVDNLLERLSQMEVSYSRMLLIKDKFPGLTDEDSIHTTVTEIDKLNQELKNASSRLKRVKEKRLRVLEMRMETYYKVKENREVIEEQLQTIEDMVEYIKDQPMTLQNTDREDVLIDNLLFETEQTQQSLEEIENLMQSEFYPGLREDFDFEEGLEDTEVENKE